MADSTPVQIANSHTQAKFTVTIAQSGTTSGAAFLGDYKIKGLEMPSGWDAADITFEVSWDGTNYHDAKKNGSTYTLTVAADDFVMIPVADSFSFPPYVKVKASAAQTTAARDIVLVLER